MSKHLTHLLIVYLPRAGEDMTKAEVIVTALETLVCVEGTLDQPVWNLRFRGFTWEHTNWHRLNEAGILSTQAGIYNTKVSR